MAHEEMDMAARKRALAKLRGLADEAMAMRLKNKKGPPAPVETDAEATPDGEEIEAKEPTGEADEEMEEDDIRRLLELYESKDEE